MVALISATPKVCWVSDIILMNIKEKSTLKVCKNQSRLEWRNKKEEFLNFFFDNIVREKNAFLVVIISLTFAKKYFDQKIVYKIKYLSYEKKAKFLSFQISFILGRYFKVSSHSLQLLTFEHILEYLLT